METTHTPRSVHRLRNRLRDARPSTPVWSIKSIAALSLLTLLLAAVIISLTGQRSWIVDTEWTLGVVSVALFGLLSVGLYRGVKLREAQAPTAELHKIDVADWTPNGVGDGIDLTGAFDVGGDDSLGCFGVLIGAVISFFALVAIVLLVYILLQLGVVLWFALMTAIYWVLHLALRQVFTHSDECHGKVLRSLGFATLYTVLCTGWMFALLFIMSAVIQ